MKYLDNNGLSYLIQKIKVWLGGKVDKVEGKTLTTNDFTNDYKSAVDSNTNARHSHGNKIVLDEITSSKVAEWDNKLDAEDVPEEVFVWDGKSSSENSSNLILFQKIYNTWVNTKKVLVIVNDSSSSTHLLSYGLLVSGSNRFSVIGHETNIYKSGNKYAFESFSRQVTATIGDDGVVTSVSALSNDSRYGNILQEESDPVFKASAAYGITSANITSWNNKANASAIPTKVSQLTNDSKYQTETEVQTAINTAVGDITGIDFQVVTSLPSTGKKGVIYLVSNSGTGQNIYDEYIWVNNKFEFIGTTAVDLSEYLKEEDVVAITNAEIDTIVA